MAKRSRRKPNKAHKSPQQEQSAPPMGPRDLYGHLTDEMGVSSGGLAERLERYDTASKVLLRMAVALAIAASSISVAGSKLIEVIRVLGQVHLM